VPVNPLRTIALAGLAASTVGASAAPAPVQTEYFVMRHLQKLTVGDDPGLTVEGARNSRRLAEWRIRWPAFNWPTAIYVSRTKRAQETARPLALRLHIEPTPYDAADVDGLIALVERESGTVLIVGHSDTVPEIVERLGGARPAAIPESRFGDIWHIWGPARRRTESIRPFP
jgi:phosphohistidine phosphatase SixA